MKIVDSFKSWWYALLYSITIRAMMWAEAKHLAMQQNLLKYKKLKLRSKRPKPKKPAITVIAEDLDETDRAAREIMLERSNESVMDDGNKP